MAGKPVVSILMNCYNSEKYLEETLTSLFNQTYENWQLVFVDNCSTDHSEQIISRYFDDVRIQYMRTPGHMPLGEAREFGMTSCTGDFVCFLDTDDLWEPSKLAVQINLFSQHPEIVMCYTGYYFIDEYSRIFRKSQLKNMMGQLFGQNLARYLVNFQTVMIRHEVLEQIERPYFDPMMRYSPDYKFIMRVLASGNAMCYEKRLAYYRVSQKSLSKQSMHLWGDEREYTYKQLDKSGVLAANSTAAQRRECQAHIAYLKAMYHASQGDYLHTRLLLKEYKLVNYKFFLAYLFSGSPKLWTLSHRIRGR